jgi:hypothetical protein
VNLDGDRDRPLSVPPALTPPMPRSRSAQRVTWQLNSLCKISTNAVSGSNRALECKNEAMASVSGLLCPWGASRVRTGSGGVTSGGSENRKWDCLAPGSILIRHKWQKYRNCGYLIPLDFLTRILTHRNLTLIC